MFFVALNNFEGGHGSQTVRKCSGDRTLHSKVKATISELINFGTHNTIGYWLPLLLTEQDAKKAISQKQQTQIEELIRLQNGKLTFYQQFKKYHSFEKYLSTVRNPHHRKSLTRLRLSAHHLPIELGRYKNIHKSERLCTLCSINTIGTETHTLFECTNTYIKEQRDIMLKSICAILPQLHQLSPHQQCIYLTKAHDINTTVIYAEYVHDILTYIDIKE